MGICDKTCQKLKNLVIIPVKRQKHFGTTNAHITSIILDIYLHVFDFHDFPRSSFVFRPSIAIEQYGATRDKILIQTADR